MVKIEAIIRTHLLEDVRTALEEIGWGRMTVTDVRGSSGQKQYAHHYRGTEYLVSLVTRTKLEIVAREEDVEPLLRTIACAARTGETGDGLIVLYPIIETIHIRTGQWGDDAL